MPETRFSSRRNCILHVFRVLKVLNVAPLQRQDLDSNKIYRFSGKLSHNNYIILVEISSFGDQDRLMCRVNCEDFILCERILICIKEIFKVQ